MREMTEARKKVVERDIIFKSMENTAEKEKDTKNSHIEKIENYCTDQKCDGF